MKFFETQAKEVCIVVKKNHSNAIVLQSGGPTAVINSSLIGIAEAWQELNDGVLFGAIHGIEGLLNDKFVKLYPRLDFQKVTAINYSPSAALGSSRHSLKNSEDETNEIEIDKIFSVMEKRRIGYVFIIGGEDSRENAHIISLHAKKTARDISVIHIPKTIDNDLTLTHHSPGFLSAAEFIINSVARLDLDNRAMPGVMIDIVMGRNAGWLAASSCIARECVASVATGEGKILEKTFAEQSAGPHLIYLPEINFSKEKFLADVSDIMKKHGRAHIVVSEGIVEHLAIKNYVKKINGIKFLNELCDVDSFGHAQLSGSGILGMLLCHMVRKNLKIKRVRANTFDYLQRCSEQSEADTTEAYKAGEYAVKAARQGVSHAMVSIGSVDKISYSGKISHIDLSLAFEKNQPKLKNFPCKWIANGNDIDNIFLRYIGATEDEIKTVSAPIFRILDLNEIV